METLLTLTFGDENIVVEGVAIKIFLPLVGEHSSDGAERGFYQTHNLILLSIVDG